MECLERVDHDKESAALRETVGRINEVSTLPLVALRVLEVANDPDATAVDMKDAIEIDPSLSARILRCVNSSAYGLRQRVSNLQWAVGLLGLREIRNLALTASVADLFKQEASIGSYGRIALWQHLVAVGIGSRLVALRQGDPDFEDAFVCGLLHDLGIALEDQYAHEDFSEVIRQLDDGQSLCEVEQRQLGFDHTQLGACIASQWHFSDGIAAAIAFHHRTAEYQGNSRQLVLSVELANALCTVRGTSSVGRKLITLSPETLCELSLTRDHLAVLAQDLDDELAKNAQLFRL